MNRRAGLSFAEVMVAVLVIAAGITPLVHMYTRVNTVAHFNEFHLLARYRARRIAQALMNKEFETLQAVAGEEGVLPIPLPEQGRELAYLAEQAPAGPNRMPQHYVPQIAKKLSWYEEQAFWEEFDPGNQAWLTVVVTWRLPGETRAHAPHELRCRRLVTLHTKSLHTATSLTAPEARSP